MRDYLLNGATVVPMTGPDDVIDEGAVVVRDGRIDEVRSGRADPATAGVDEVLDLDGTVVMPGLVNAHTHLYQTLLRATWEDIPLLPWLERVYGTAEVLEPYDCRIGTALGVAESLRSGVTTALEHQFLNPTYEHTAETVEAMLSGGIRTVFARTIMDRGDIVPPVVTEEPEAALAEVERLIEEYGDPPACTIRTGPNTPPVNTTMDCCRAMAEFCEERGVGVSAHVAESRGVIEAVEEEGFDGVVEYLDAAGLTGPDAVYAHCVHLSESEVTLVADTGSAISHNPVSNMMLGDGIAPIVECLEAGATVGLGTDGAASNHSQNMVETMKAASLLQKVGHEDPGVIDPYEVLEMATRGGARAVGLGDRVGTLEPGRRADLIVVDLESSLHNVALNDLCSQLVHTMQAGDVRHTMVDGRLVMRDRTLATLDGEFLRREGQRVAEDLQDRVADLGF